MNAVAALLLCLQDPVEKPKSQEKEVVVTASRRESDVLDVPSAVTVVTGRQIKESGATNIVEVVQKQPGFFAQGQNKGAYDQIVDIRGYNNGTGNGQRTLVLVDGRKTNSVDGAFTDWASIPIENIERVEIVRGPASALYGDGALAGVVNIITKKGGKEGFSSMSLSGGAWRTYRAGAGAGGSAGELNYDLFVGIEGTDGWRDHSKYQGDDVTARFEFPINPTLRASVKIGHHNDRRQQPGTLSGPQIDQLGRDGADPTRIGNTDLREDYAHAGLVQSLDELGEASLFVNHTLRDHNLFSRQFGGVLADDQAQITMLQLKHVVTPGALSKRATFTSGVDLSYETAAAESGPPGGAPDESNYRRRLMGFYEGVEVRPVDPILLTGGLRVDRALLTLDRRAAPLGFGSNADDQRAFNEVSPYAGLTWRILDELSAYVSWGRTFKLPTRDELVGFLTTDPLLKPERAMLYEAGLRFWSGAWGSAGATVYRMDVHNELFFDSATFATINFDRVVHAGIEADARVTPCPCVEFFGSYAFTRVEIEEGLTPSQEGKTYPVTPRLSGSGGATFRYEGAALTVSGRYAGRRYLINDFDNVGETLPDYLVLDLRLSYTWRFLTAFVSVYNLTGREYHDSGGYGFGFGDRYSPAPERSWLVGGEVRF